MRLVVQKIIFDFLCYIKHANHLILDVVSGMCLT